MKYKLPVLFLSGISGVLFLLFSHYVRSGRLDKFDFNTLVKIQDRFPASLDGWMSFFTLLGSFEITTFFLGLLVIFLLVRRKWFAVFIPFFFAFGMYIELVGKIKIEHYGPPMYFLRQKALEIFPQWYAHPVSSYPSGHSLRAAFLFVVIAWVIFHSKKLAKGHKTLAVLGFAGLAGLIMLSRTVLGEHWPTDVVGGAFLGGSLGLFSLLFL